MNQKILPLTAKWHRLVIQGAFSEEEKRKEFRQDLAQLQTTLRNYTKMLADMAGVEDLTSLEEEY